MRPPPSAAPPRWQTDPYRPFFVLGMVLAWAGVGQWLLLALGVTEEYRSIFHSMAQIQGFMTCFAIGFLFTFVPRRTGTPGPAAWQMGIALVAPVGVTLFAWLEQWAVSQTFWLALTVAVGSFVLRRMLSPGGQRLAPPFVWVPASLAVGAVGSILTAIGATNADTLWWLHDVGRWLVLQCMISGLVLGVGATLLPTLLYTGQPLLVSPESRARHVALQLGLFSLFTASFFLEALVSARLGFAVRAAAALGVLAPIRLLWRPPAMPGFHRRLMWLAPWMLPLGYALGAALPEYRRIALHTVFIGCFALLVFAVSIHVSLSHGGKPERLAGRPWQAVAVAGLLGVALAFRAVLDLDQVRFNVWLGVAASCFLVATVCWALLVAPALRR